MDKRLDGLRTEPNPIIQFVSSLKRRREWWPSNTGFMLRSLVVRDGTKWTACYKIDAIWEGPRRVLFKANVTLWPGYQRRGVASAWRDTKVKKEILQLLTKRGYRGRWRELDSGNLGHFWKNLGNKEKVAAEVKWLSEMSLGDE